MILTILLPFLLVYLHKKFVSMYTTIIRNTLTKETLKMFTLQADRYAAPRLVLLLWFVNHYIHILVWNSNVFASINIVTLSDSTCYFHISFEAPLPAPPRGSAAYRGIWQLL